MNIRQRTLMLVGLFIAAVYAGYFIHVFRTCDGHVLKNALDVPVCIK